MITRRRRIGFPFSGERLGGSHFSVLLLLQALMESAFEPVVIVHREGEVADHFRRGGVPVLIEPLPASDDWNGGSHRRLLAGLKAIAGVGQLIRKHRLDLVHANDHKIMQLWVLGSRLARRPFLLHWRGVYRGSFLTRIMMSFASRYIVISEFVRRQYPGSIARQAHLLHNPFASDALPPAPSAARAALRERLEIPMDAKVLCWIGNCDVRKRPREFIDIVVEVAARSKARPVRGIMCGGGGNMSDDPRLQAALGEHQAIVHHLGFVESMYPVLAGCDALIVTAVDEPFGRTLIEAMLCGVPVIATAHGGNPEAIEDGQTGILFEPDDIKAAAARTVELLARPAMAAAIAENAGRAARERFSVRRHAEGVIELYEQMLDQPRPALEAMMAE